MCRLGQLYLDGGRWNGTQILPETWVETAARPDGDHVRPGVIHGSVFGYGFQRWIAGTRGEF
jgi:CubicO group peptidase (beta-lactamase class C family)